MSKVADWTAGVSRRRFLSISAAFCGVGALAARAGAPPRSLERVAWRGIALGAPASIALYTTDKEAAQISLSRAVAELERLEQIFSLHRHRSALVRLNDNGALIDPPFDLVRLLTTSNALSKATSGAFDPTIQPLWELYAEHFARSPLDRVGPAADQLQGRMRLVGYRKMGVDSKRIAFEVPGMKLTLNGIAQGYITDRIVDLLRQEGFENFVANLGEPRAVGSHPTGRPWRVAITSPEGAQNDAQKISIVDRAVATSAPSGSPFESTGRFHHLLDPRTGRCPRIHQRVSVIAPTATIADGLSTSFAVMGESEIGLASQHFSDIRTILG
jgi:FAD:protein FMN transferase